MGDWYKVMVFKGFKIFDVHPNQVFNVSGFVKPNINYTYIKLLTTTSQYDSTLTLNNLGNGNYSLTADSKVRTDSIIRVLVVEGDG